MISAMPKNPVKRADQSKQTAIDFELQAAQVLSDLQSAVSGLISAIPAPGRIERPTDLQRVLGIHSKLAWQTFRIANATNALGEGRAVPGPTAMNRFLSAAIKRGVPPAPIEHVRQALGRFEELVRVHAGNRGVFDSMIGSLAVDGSDQLDMVHRRAAFRAYAHFLGARAKAILSFNALQPSREDPNTLEWLGLKGSIGLSTQRRDASWELSTFIPYRREGDPEGKTSVVSLDAPESSGGISLFREFCTMPLPPLKFVPRERGSMSVLVGGEFIDQRSPVDLVVAFLATDGEPRYRTSENSILNVGCCVRVPSEVLILDVLIRRDVFQHASPCVGVFHMLAGSPAENKLSEHDRLPMRESVIFAGRGSTVLETKEIPRYAEMAGAAMSRVGWDPEQFDVYRCRMEFPVVPSGVEITFELPEAPQ